MLGPMVAPSLGSLVVAAWATGAGLLGVRAAAAAVGRLALFAVLVLVGDEYPALETGVGTLAVLCVVDPHGQNVLAMLPAVLVVGAVAGLFAVVDRVEAPTRAAGDEVEVLAGVADL